MAAPPLEQRPHGAEGPGLEDQRHHRGAVVGGASTDERGATAERAGDRCLDGLREGREGSPEIRGRIQEEDVLEGPGGILRGGEAARDQDLPVVQADAGVLVARDREGREGREALRLGVEDVAEIDEEGVLSLAAGDGDSSLPQPGDPRGEP